MIHAGRKIGHIDAEQGNALIIPGENPEDMKARMLGMARAEGLRTKQLPYILPGAFPMTEEAAELLILAGQRTGGATCVRD